MNFSNAVKKSAPSYPMPPMPSLTNRVSYVPRNGYATETVVNVHTPPPIVPPVEESSSCLGSLTQIISPTPLDPSTTSPSVDSPTVESAAPLVEPAAPAVEPAAPLVEPAGPSVVPAAPSVDIDNELDIDMADKYFNIESTKSKKRVNSTSPVNVSNDKKICIESKSELDCLIPVIKDIEPSVDPDIIIKLIEDLKKQPIKKKLDIIKSNYDMEPLFVTSLLEKLISIESNSIQPRLKNRLKNLNKTILTASHDAISSGTPTPTPTSQA
ncbi:hypothetical protein M8J76_006856 [Diaphorina citri]|nr:hypothetical protein M8J76_006856 [Diaphorina citri]